MSDLISRSEVTESIKRQYCTGCDNYNGVRCRACHADDMLSLVDDAADAGPRWISVEERLPESKTPAYENDMSNAVLLYTPVDGYVHIGWYVRKDYRGRDVWHTLSAMRSHQTLTKNVTHWMYLPEPPKEETT